jgi:L-lactate dehydrogenase complex protein LldG
MKVSPAKENILKRVRNALSQPVQLPFPQAEGNNSVFKTSHEGLEIKFAEEFSKLQGRFVFCASHEELAQSLAMLAENKQWTNIYCQELQLLHVLEPYHLACLNAGEGGLQTADAGITSCELLVARTGSVVLSAAQPSGRSVGVFSPVHIVIAYVSQLVFDIKDALQHLKEKYGEQIPSMISFQTGPSRTADIEKTLVVGVHGPREVFVFLIDEAGDEMKA